MKAARRDDSDEAGSWSREALCYLNCVLDLGVPFDAILGDPDEDSVYPIKVT